MEGEVSVPVLLSLMAGSIPVTLLSEFLGADKNTVLNQHVSQLTSTPVPFPSMYAYYSNMLDLYYYGTAIRPLFSPPTAR